MKMFRLQLYGVIVKMLIEVEQIDGARSQHSNLD